MFHVKRIILIMKKFTSKNQRIGAIGEQIAQDFLVQQGIQICETNYSCRLGEIDIIAKRNNCIHFIEVKTITFSLENNKLPGKVTHNVSRETFIKEYRRTTNSFQNITPQKLKKIVRTIYHYLHTKHIPINNPWQIDGIGITIDTATKNIRKLEYIEHINL